MRQGSPSKEITNPTSMAGLTTTRPMARARRGMVEMEAQWAIQADIFAQIIPSPWRNKRM